jgi:hypothetical protein
LLRLLRLLFHGYSLLVLLSFPPSLHLPSWPRDHPCYLLHTTTNAHAAFPSRRPSFSHPGAIHLQEGDLGHASSVHAPHEAITLWDEVTGYDTVPSSGRHMASATTSGAATPSRTLSRSGTAVSLSRVAGGLPPARSPQSSLGRHKPSGPQPSQRLAGSSLARLQSPVKLQSLSQPNTSRLGFGLESRVRGGTESQHALAQPHHQSHHGGVEVSEMTGLVLNSRLTRVNTRSRKQELNPGAGLVVDSGTPWSPVVVGMVAKGDRDVIFECGTMSPLPRGAKGAASRWMGDATVGGDGTDHGPELDGSPGTLAHGSAGVGGGYPSTVLPPHVQVPYVQVPCVGCRSHDWPARTPLLRY